MRHVIVGVRGERQISIAYIEDTQNVLCRSFVPFFFFWLHSVFVFRFSLEMRIQSCMNHCVNKFCIQSYSICIRQDLCATWFSVCVFRIYFSSIVAHWHMVLNAHRNRCKLQTWWVSDRVAFTPNSLIFLSERGQLHYTAI